MDMGVTAARPVCAELRPGYYIQNHLLIKATKPFNGLNIDFKGPVLSNNGTFYILMIIDEYSLFPFGYSCRDTSSGTVKQKFYNLFISTSSNTPNNPEELERYTRILWKPMTLPIQNKGYDMTHLENTYRNHGMPFDFFCICLQLYTYTEEGCSFVQVAPQMLLYLRGLCIQGRY